MPDSSQDPVTLLTTLFAALGLSSTAGIRAYLPLLAVGLASDAGLVKLQGSFADLGSPALLIVLALLVVAEFIVDKIPVIDHISDLIHTVIRPISGAVIMAGTANPISESNAWLAAAIGAALAFAFHGAKAATRPAVSATTAGIGNPIVSVIEDVAAVLLSLLLLFAPIIGVILLILIAIAFVRVVSRIFRKLTGGRRSLTPSAAAVYSSAGTTPGYGGSGSGGGVGSRPRIGGLIGRAGRRSSASTAGNDSVLPVPTPAAVVPLASPAPLTPPTVAPAVPTYVSPNATTVAGTNQAPFAPNYSNPIQPDPPTSTPYPAPTQTFPPVYPPPWPAQPPAPPYADDAPTSPGKYTGNA